jgi:hypothetical protein
MIQSKFRGSENRKPNVFASGRWTREVTKIQANAIQNRRRRVGLGVQITDSMSP